MFIRRVNLRFEGRDRLGDDEIGDVEIGDEGIGDHRSNSDWTDGIEDSDRIGRDRICGKVISDMIGDSIGEGGGDDGIDSDGIDGIDGSGNWINSLDGSSRTVDFDGDFRFIMLMVD